MKFQDIMIPLLFTVLLVWGLQYFVINKHLPLPAGEVKSGQSFIAPLSDQVIKPLSIEVNFSEQPVQEKIVTEIETPGALYRFSTAGASLEQITYKRVESSGKKLEINFMPSVVERDDHPFLLGLNVDAPFYYKLADKQELPETIKLVYQASTPTVSIQKEYTIFKNTYQIDLAVTLEPHDIINEPLQARLFVPAPFMIDPHLKDTVAAILYNESDKLQKIKPNDVKQQLWVAPTFFGAENRYFANVLLQDPDHFIQRGYYKISNASPLTAVLEGIPVKSKGSWRLSFY
ncbi:MAG TPA: hypothetical protein VHA52_04095, partial [Candidatus Babeliaceae bacterium]|nr:hypothetical protein [Candidatus Babeliaceae bacterium]